MAFGGKGVKFSITATDRTQAAFSAVQQNMRRTQGLQRSWNAGLNANRRAVQQLGFQVSDFAVQIAGGQSAMLAFTQQGGQMLQFFGPAGSIMAAFLAIFGSLAIAFTKSGKALSELTPIMGVLQEEFVALGTLLGQVKEIAIDFANVVINNMDRILITVTTVVGFMAGRWVVAFVAARIATFTLVGALAALRVALIRTGIGALVVGAGELVYQFTRLVKAAGSFGEALSMLKDVAVEVFGRIVTAFGVVPLAIQAGANSMAAFFIGALNRMLGNFMEFTWQIAEGLNSLFGTNLQGLKAGRLTQDLTQLQREFQDTASAASSSISGITADVTAPLQSVQRIRDAIKSVDDAGRDIDIRDWFGGGDGDGGDAAGSGAKDAANSMAEKAKEIQKVYEDMVSTVKDGLSSMFKSLFDETKSFADAARSALGTILDKVADMILDPIWDSLARTITNTLIGSRKNDSSTRLIGGLFSGLLGFEGGGHTGQGSRSGGLDGKGGRLAIVHPRETIIDNTRANGGLTMSGGAGASGTVVIKLSDGLRAEMQGEMRGIAVETVDQKSAGIVRQSVVQSGKMSQATKRYGRI